jgi:hypothetical protein
MRIYDRRLVEGSFLILEVSSSGRGSPISDRNSLCSSVKFCILRNLVLLNFGLRNAYVSMVSQG